MLITLHLCVLCGIVLFALYIINRLVFVTVAESVYWAVRNES